MKFQSNIKIANIKIGQKTARLLIIVAFCLPVSVQAVVVEDLFEVTLPVPDETREGRRAALSDGLVEVLIRVSGDGQLLQKLNPPNAASYVKQFRYVAAETEAIPDPQANVTTEPEKQLWVQYNATRVMDFLRANALPIWGDHRSEMVVWLAVRDGANNYIFKEDDISPIKTLTERIFKQRGVPVIWPKFDAEDKKRLAFADVWGGFREPLAMASKRYSNGPVLSGSMSWNGREWVSNWILQMDRENQWSITNGNHDSLIAEITGLVSNTLGNKYAALESVDAADESHVLINIDQVNTVASYVELENYLTTLPSVQKVWLSRIEPGRAIFSVALRSQVNDFLALLKTGSLIKPVVKVGQKSDPSKINKNSYQYILSKSN